MPGGTSLRFKNQFYVRKRPRTLFIRIMGDYPLMAPADSPPTMYFWK